MSVHSIPTFVSPLLTPCRRHPFPGFPLGKRSNHRFRLSPNSSRHLLASNPLTLGSSAGRHSRARRCKLDFNGSSQSPRSHSKTIEGTRGGDECYRCDEIKSAGKDDDCESPVAVSVSQVLKRRFETGSKPGHRDDNCRVALCIEGGGMRGAISAGMTAAIEHLRLSDAFDVVYGSSAGAIVGAYFVSRQLPLFGARIYYDLLCAPHKHGPFIDVRAFRNHPYVQKLLGVLRERPSDKTEHIVSKRKENKRPVLWLDRLIWEVMKERAPLDWQRFWNNHLVQPLVPVAASLTRQKTHTFRDVQTFDGLLRRLRASASVAGIAGDLAEVDGNVYADALIYEAIPVECARKDGATHMVILRTRQGCAGVPKRVGVYEWLIAPPYIREILRHAPRHAAQVVQFLRSGSHIAAYRNAVQQIDDMSVDTVLSIEPGENAVRVRQLETSARAVFDGVRAGFVAGIDALGNLVADSSNSNERVRGVDAVNEVFPNEEIEGILWKHKALRTKYRNLRRRSRRINGIRAETREKASM